MDVDQEIDELISDSPPRKPVALPPTTTTTSVSTPNGDTQDTTCHWNGCDQPFVNEKALGEHVVTEHIPEKKPFTCEWDGCARKGHEQNSKFQLNTHVRSHTGEKPFECTRPNCGRAFVRNDALQKHLRQHDTAEAQDIPMPVPKKSKPKASKAKVEPKVEPALSTNGSSSNTPRASTGPTSAAPLLKADPTPQPISSSHDVRRASHDVHARSPYPAGPSTLRHFAERPAPPLQFDWNEARSAGLYEDIDLTDVLTSLHASEPFWSISSRDAEALEIVKRLHPQAPDTEYSSDDEFDEGVSKRYPRHPEVVAQIPDEHSDIQVLSRPRWQVKYVMAKAKLMLVEEENRMRREQLKDWIKKEELMGEGAEMKDLGAAGKAFAEMVREDATREMEKLTLVQRGSNGHSNGA